MKFNVSAVSIRHPIPPIVLFILLMIAGIISFMSLDVTDNPDIDIPMVMVNVNRPGAAPTEMEIQVTKKIEDAVAGLGSIDHIQSTITDGLSRTQIEFAIGTNTDRAVNDVRDAVSKIRQNLPQDILEPSVERLNIAGQPILYFSVLAPGLNTEQLSWLIDNDISRAMLSVKGVALMQRVGGVDREVRIELDPQRLIALGITADAVNAQLVGLNIDIPGGRGNVGGAEQSIRTLGSAHRVEDLRNTEISLPSGRKARLSELGKVIDGPSEQRQAARYDGVPVVSFNIQRSPNTSDVTIAKGIFKQIDALKVRYPGVEFKQVVSTVDFTIEAYDASVDALSIGAFLAIVVVFWFLRDWRATLISAAAMPLSAIPTFAVMQMLGFTLNGISMLALSLVVGILVDDAIVEIENIVRHIRQGKSPYQAALEAADEIGLAVIATTATIMVVFLPVSFMGGVPGQFFRQFGITVAVAVFFSLLVARLITPMMAAYLLKSHPEETPPRWLSLYLRTLRWSMGQRWLSFPAFRLTVGGHRLSVPALRWQFGHRWFVMIGATLIFFGSVALVPFIPTGFFPDTDQSQSELQIEMPPGATLADNLAVTSHLSDMLRARPEVRHVLVSAGGQGDIRKANLFVKLAPRSERTLTQKQFESSMRPALLAVPGIRFGFAGTGFGEKDISVLLSGDDGPALEEVSDRLLKEIATIPEVVNTASTASLLRPEVLIKPMFDRAAQAGVSVQQIGRVAMLATLGDLDQNLAKFNMGDRQIPIRVQLDPATRNDLGTIENLRVMTSSGASVPLKSVADISLGAGPAQIDRFDRSRKVAVEGDLVAGAEIGPALAKIYELPVLKNLPPEVHLSKYGNAEQMGVLQKDFGTALMASLLLIFAVLVLLFGNFFQPPTIMMALPLSVGGALVALLLTHKALSMPAMIGLLMLMGIVTKNSILLVEYAIVAIRDRGLCRSDALIDAGAKRARPIVMTTVAMIAGMMPIAIGLGADSDFRSPMAIAVVGGLITSTLLSLVVIPSVFTVFDDLQRIVVRRLKRLLTVDHDAAHTPVLPSAE
jgi:HAE1 family hydrophobic/amphiphilic exporter-1